MEALPFKHNGYKHKRQVAGHKGLNIKQLWRLQDTTLTINDSEGRARRIWRRNQTFKHIDVTTE